MILRAIAAAIARKIITRSRATFGSQRSGEWRHAIDFSSRRKALIGITMKAVVLLAALLLAAHLPPAATRSVMHHRSILQAAAAANDTADLVDEEADSPVPTPAPSAAIKASPVPAAKAPALDVALDVALDAALGAAIDAGLTTAGSQPTMPPDPNDLMKQLVATLPKERLNGSDPYRICVPDTTLPWAICSGDIQTSNGTNAGFDIATDASSVTGFEANAVKKVLKDSFKWEYGRQYVFVCYGSKTDILNDLDPSLGDANCDIAAAGIDISTDLVRRGILFGIVPTYRSGLAVVTSANVEVGTMWFFLKPFSWGVWLTWIIMTIVMVFVFYFFEIAAGATSNRFAKGWGGVKESSINTLMFSFGRKGPTLGEVLSTPARLMAVAYVFFLMIFVQLYTAQLAGSLAALNIRAQVSGLSDLVTQQLHTVVPSDLKSQVAPAWRHLLHGEG